MTDYAKLGTIINGLAMTFSSKDTTLDKPLVKMLLSIAQSDRERECIRYAVVKPSGMTPTCARRVYGFERMQARAASVETALLEVQQIRQSIDDLAKIEDRALLASFGVHVAPDSSSDEEDEEETLSPQDLEILSPHWPVDFNFSSSPEPPCDDLSKNPVDMKHLLDECEYNWFEMIDQLSQEPGQVCTNSEYLLNEISKIELDAHALQLIEQSHLAYLSAINQSYQFNQVSQGCSVTIFFHCLH